MFMHRWSSPAVSVAFHPPVPIASPQTIALSSCTLPAGHGAHADTSTAPAPGAYLPAAQRVQVLPAP